MRLIWQIATAPARLTGRIVLDTLLGPPETFENVPDTTPSSPPPRF